MNNPLCCDFVIHWLTKVHYVILADKKQNLQFAKEHCFGCALALYDCADEFGYPAAHETFTTSLKRSV